MRGYDVSVRNEFTGEIRIVRVTAGYETDAQVVALHQLFHVEGWRRATALQPQVSDPEVDA